MDRIKDILEECSIRDIYMGDGTAVMYRIPIYQRNYAWGQDEIESLIKDVCDSMAASKQVYYIGTLVTYKRDENVYEVIDGQQRLTTLYIILKALGEPVLNKLTYSARQISTKTIEAMSRFNYDRVFDFGEEYDFGIKRGFDFARSAIEKLSDIDKFKSYFLNNVHIIRYRVPKDVDLNHYFEVMNSRGEQLEKHEIVKAKLSEKLDGESMEQFCEIWEACSDMSFYIQQNLKLNSAVFGNDLSGFVLKSFDDFPISNHSELTKKSINDLLLGMSVNRPGDKRTIDRNDAFQPIIDFPNLLLVVLKVTRMSEDGFDYKKFMLDDKELISEFDNVSLSPDFVKRFAYNLLRARYYIDNYVVHHIVGDERTIENPWKIQRFYRNGNSLYPKDLLEDKLKQSELVHLLSMFEVAFTAKQRKNYLFYCLLHLFENDDSDQYLDFMRKLADKCFFDIYLDRSKLSERNQPKPNSFDEAVFAGHSLNVALCNSKRNYYDDFNNAYPQGCSNIPVFVFNYTDYRIWKKYADELRGRGEKKGSEARNRFFEELGCSDFDLEVFDSFYFSRTRKSLEHYFPKAKAGEGKSISSTEVNCFGNFAMIGAEANSSGSNWNPLEKNNRYLDVKSNQVSVASLKFRIMLQICKDNYDKGVRGENGGRKSGDEWNVEDMNHHQSKILDIILQKK